MDLGLAGRVYIVTGGSRGLGRATADALAAEGAKLVISSRDPESVQRAVSELGGPGTAVGIPGDNADPELADRLLAAAQTTFGRIDGALVSVGGPPPATAAGATDQQWRDAFESVFLGTVRVARTVAEACAERAAEGTGEDRPQDASIAFVLSTSVRQPLPRLGISNGLRPGLAGVAKDMAEEYGPRGVRVNAVLPGAIATDRMLELAAGRGDTDPAERRRQRAANIPLRRIGEPAEFGRVAAFVLSPAASYLSGVMLPVDGASTRAL